MTIVRPIAKWQPILCGPMLRRVTPTSVCVFAALKDPADICLEIYRENTPNSRNYLLLGDGCAHTVALGKNLHVVVVEASLSGQGTLQPGIVYSYDLFITFDGSVFAQNLEDLGLLDNPLPLGYEVRRLPSFALPPGLDQVHLVHGSCRKAGGEGSDALATLDALIQRSYQDPLERPHQLLLTGDQIYADDVPACLLVTLNQTAGLLLGWTEPETFPNKGGAILPGDPRLAPGHARKEFDLWHKPVNPTSADSRLRFANFRTRLEYMFTQTDFSSVEADSHLLFWGEFIAQYLFAWSPELWPQDDHGNLDLTSLAELTELWNHPPYAGPDAEDYASGQVDFLLTAKNVRKQALNFGAGMARVRRALANVPTYMIFDDHDVTDDWNIFRTWKEAVLANPAGRQIVRNALAAYAVFQDWGNDPQKYSSGPGAELLAALTSDENGSPPPIVGEPDLLNAILRLDAVSTPLPDPALELRWDYVIKTPAYQVLMLDTRTWRGFANGADGKVPAALIRSDMIPLQFGNLDAGKQTLVVSSGPAFGHGLVDAVQVGKRFVVNKEEADYERWNLNETAFNELLNQLAGLEKVVYLCGDVHYAFAKRIDLDLTRFDHLGTPRQVVKKARLVQFCCSSLHNETLETRILEATGAVNTAHDYAFPPDLAVHQDELNARLEAHFQAAIVDASALADPDYTNRLIDTLADIHEKRRLGMAVSIPQQAGPAYERVKEVIRDTELLWECEVTGVESPLDTVKAFNNSLANAVIGAVLPNIYSMFVIGHNNIGLITFKNSAGAGQVIQTLFWHLAVPLLGDQIWALDFPVSLSID